MKKSLLTLCLITLFVVACKKEKKTETTIVETEAKQEETPVEPLKIIPIEHATMVLESGDEVIYVDPVGGLQAFEAQKTPTLVLITDIHGDHLDLATLEELKLNNATLIAPEAVTKTLPKTIAKTIVTLNNNDKHTINTLTVEAIAMYNLRDEALKFHPKGRGNGYVLTLGGERIYISGDTEDIPEMRALKNIDRAFICMNLPYTMTVESAANAVLEFKPKQIYPYHYRGTDGFSDVTLFKELVTKSSNSIEIIQLNWYK
ncbi:MBL fold metallo-hydrolase [Lacinutrix salivirga]